MYELKAPLTLGALEFYLGPGYTEWELKEDTWRNSWKTWDFGMWKKQLLGACPSFIASSGYLKHWS
jgi:hypothetical protein